MLNNSGCQQVVGSMARPSDTLTIGPWLGGFCNEGCIIVKL